MEFISLMDVSVLSTQAPNGFKEIISMFGKPNNADGTLNKAWEAANVTVLRPTKGWQLYYQNAPNSLIPVQGLSLHRLLAKSFEAVMTEIWDHVKGDIGNNSSDNAVRASLHEQRLDIIGGGFNYRKSTGDASKLSLHSYGIAIDWDPLHNPHQNPLQKTLPDWWYAVWNDHGWNDGRHFTTPDPMHLQFATGA